MEHEALFSLLNSLVRGNIRRSFVISSFFNRISDSCPPVLKWFIRSWDHYNITFWSLPSQLPLHSSTPWNFPFLLNVQMKRTFTNAFLLFRRILRWFLVSDQIPFFLFFWSASFSWTLLKCARRICSTVFRSPNIGVIWILCSQRKFSNWY